MTLWVYLAAFFVISCQISDSSVVPGTGLPLCYQCSSYDQDLRNWACPSDSHVDIRLVFKAPCKGVCFTRNDQSNPALIYRGCTAGQWGLPDPLPQDGCYSWEERAQVWCVCRTDRCNGQKMGQAGNVSFEDHLKQDGNSPVNGGEGQTNGSILPPSYQNKSLGEGEVLCWQCQSYLNGQHYSHCAMHSPVDPRKAFITNCTGRCLTFTSRDPQDDTQVVTRTCSSFVWALPDPLPEDGCYTWRNATYCVCSEHGCNGLSLGKPRNLSLDAHLHKQNEGSGNALLPPALQHGQNISGLTLCWQCLSFFKGQHYDFCPLHGPVDPTRAYIANCTGHCFTHNSTQSSGIEVLARGCSSSQWGLPDPLPEDGCYKWYSELWCVCSTDGCNGLPMGAPGPMEFDGYTGINAGSPLRRCIVHLWLLLLMSWVY